MKHYRIFLLCILIFISYKTYSQKVFYINLDNVPIKIENRDFYISKVEDIRDNKEDIGFIKKGLANKEYRAKFQNGVESSFQKYFDHNLPANKDLAPIVLKIKKLDISENAAHGQEYAFASIAVEFWSSDTKIFESEANAKVSGYDVTDYHESNIRLALNDCLIEFSESDWDAPLPNNDIVEVQTTDDDDSEVFTNEEQAQNIVQENTSTNTPVEDRNIFALGYQIGGLNLVGIDYEIRLHDFVGLHFGVGLLGYTAGLKIHTSPLKNSSFFNLSYKDLGIGMIDAIGMEYGGRWVFFKRSDFGLHYQVGLAFVTSYDKDFVNTVYGSTDMPPAMLSTGLGFSW